MSNDIDVIKGRIGPLMNDATGLWGHFRELAQYVMTLKRIKVGKATMQQLQMRYSDEKLRQTKDERKFIKGSLVYSNESSNYEGFWHSNSHH